MKNEDIQLCDADYELYNWQMSERLSSFKNCLFQAISKSDNSNMHLISLGFPEEVNAYKRFISEQGYWNNVCCKIEGN